MKLKLRISGMAVLAAAVGTFALAHILDVAFRTPIECVVLATAGAFGLAAFIASFVIEDISEPSL